MNQNVCSQRLLSTPRPGQPCRMGKAYSLTTVPTGNLPSPTGGFHGDSPARELNAQTISAASVLFATTRPWGMPK